MVIKMLVSAIQKISEEETPKINRGNSFFVEIYRISTNEFQSKANFTDESKKKGFLNPNWKNIKVLLQQVNCTGVLNIFTS